MGECQVYYLTFERMCQNPVFLQSLWTEYYCSDYIAPGNLTLLLGTRVPVLLCYAVSYLWYSWSESFEFLGCRAILLPLKCAKNADRKSVV